MAERSTPGRDWVALTLAIGVVAAFNMITVSVLLAAFHRGRVTGDYSLSENATQVLIAGFGGFIGILGGYIGGTAVERARHAERDRIRGDLADMAAADETTDVVGAPLSDDSEPDAQT